MAAGKIGLETGDQGGSELNDIAGLESGDEAADADVARGGAGADAPAKAAQSIAHRRRPRSPPTLMPPYNPVHMESDDNKGLAPKSAASARSSAPR